jgi:hypothetical protein
MSPQASVSGDELVRALDRRNATLPAEIGTFLVFEGCESMLQNGPREVSGLGSVRISEHGVVTLGGAACDDETCARGLHQLLSTLLLAAGPALSPALTRLTQDGPRGGKFTLRGLHDELEAALVPLNRNASRRVLSRFAREAAQPMVASEDVDAALSSLLGVSDRPANDGPSSLGARARPSLAPEPLQVDLFDGMELGGEESRYLEPSPAARELDDPLRGSSLRTSGRPSFAPTPAQDRDRLRSLRALAGEASTDDGGVSSRKLLIGFSLIALAIVSVAVAMSLRVPEPARPLANARVLDDSAASVRGGDLVVRVAQPNAQVLRFVGRAPVTVPDLPVGIAHEFVATAEGHRPSRVLVPASADWEATAEGARYELALQLAPIEPGVGAAPPATDEALALGPSRLAAQDGQRTTRLGSVRVVATPRGARVYQLVGFSPEVQVQDVPLDQPQELLIYREGYAPVVRALSEADFVSKSGRRVAELDVELHKLR